MNKKLLLTVICVAAGTVAFGQVPAKKESGNSKSEQGKVEKTNFEDHVKVERSGENNTPEPKSVYNGPEVKSTQEKSLPPEPTKSTPSNSGGGAKTSGSAY